MLSLAAAASALVVRPVLAKGNLASNPVRLPELKIDTVNLKYSVNEYTLETGKYYFWTISCDDAEEGIEVMAPELFQNSWVNQIVANDIVTHTTSFSSIEFGNAGSVQIQFMPIRPGAYAFYSPGFENKGLKGQIIVN
ncbi:MAG TPA: hypothetical protein VGO70_05040 [Arsenicitalea sp.]|jgi:hypothetical protein|nr:hypothetical protein [Arsenicitalea sp.]